MAITVQALQADGTWGVRNAFTTENAKVRASSMTAADLEALARATMSKWQSMQDGKQLRVHNSDNDAKQASQSPASDGDQFRISPRGACLVAALDYEATFGKDSSGKSALAIADEMAARLARPFHNVPKNRG